uniref:Lipoprotein n=1 Tax=uncultured marine microorganism HF4000_141I21 TaxID=455526 RepID=B3T2J9_9ZZZZ|nr:hypothetical protein ALOHA_HF4000141I21ctg1g30 [uncultured marine microorganism HF4000_141I21]
MIKKLLVLTTLSVMLSGCFMVPMAFLGPAVSGFSTASLAQSAVTTGASYMVKKNTGKTITEHVFDTINPGIVKQSYMPKEKENVTTLIFLKSKPIK